MNNSPLIVVQGPIYHFQGRVRELINEGYQPRFESFTLNEEGMPTMLMSKSMCPFCGYDGDTGTFPGEGDLCED